MKVFVTGATGVLERVSNRRFADATGWSPRHADALQGWTAMLPDLPP